MKRAGAACIAIVATLFGATLDAQRLAPAVLSSSTPSTVFHRPPPSSTDLPRAKDYTMEGAAIGGLALGVFGAYFGGGMCGMDDGGGRNCTLAALTGFLSGASVGATIGGIVGSAKKKTPAEESPQVPVRADSTLFPRAPSHGGNGTALGAVMVGGAVAVFTTLDCALDRSGGHENCAWKSLKRGAIGAAIGGLTGAFVDAVLSPGIRDP
jgi:hypothetical protein